MNDCDHRLEEAGRSAATRSAADRIFNASQANNKGTTTMRHTESDVYSERTARQSTSFIRNVIDATIPGRDPRGEARRRLEQHETEARATWNSVRRG